MFDSLSSINPSKKSNIISTLTFLLITLVIISSNTIISDVSFINSDVVFLHDELKNSRALHGDADVDDPRFFDESHVVGERGFDREITHFFIRNRCKVQFFMTWISPLDSFGEREFFGLNSLFKTNPNGCLVILSNSLDSIHGSKLLHPLIKAGFRLQAIALDLSSLFNNTPAEIWLDEIKNGRKNAGEIPLPQNLSNLIRLAALYKYGGIYLDTDFIILKDLSRLRNCIGTQSVDVNGNWTRLNNAILIFDKNHELLHMFMEEFASTFDGNIWGHNGPYLVTRVVNRVLTFRGGFNFSFTILPPIAFYPVNWIRISKFFAQPNRFDPVGRKWVRAKVRQLSLDSYGVHLWNRESSRLKIEEGSIISSLISDRCVLCKKTILPS